MMWYLSVLELLKNLRSDAVIGFSAILGQSITSGLPVTLTIISFKHLLRTSGSAICTVPSAVSIGRQTSCYPLPHRMLTMILLCRPRVKATKSRVLTSATFISPMVSLMCYRVTSLIIKLIFSILFLKKAVDSAFRRGAYSSLFVDNDEMIDSNRGLAVSPYIIACLE